MGHHHHHHGHEHHHSHQTDNIALAFFLNLGFTILEIFGGFYVNSVAIMSDAVHDLGDSISLGISWYLQKQSHKGVTEVYTFGYKRFSLLGALINSLILILGTGYVIVTASQRIMHPEPADPKGMLWFALLGVAVNGFAAFKLSKGKSINEKVLSWHLIEDVLGWVAVLIVSIVMLFWDLPILDPILSLLIAAFVLYNVVKRLKEVMFVFLQGTPPEVDFTALKQKLAAIPQINSIHHLHLWSLDEDHKIFTVHVRPIHIYQLDELIALKNTIKGILHEFDINHATIDIELEGETYSIGPEVP